MSLLPIYLLMVNYNRKDSAKDVITDFINSVKPNNPTTLIVIENGENKTLKKDVNLTNTTDILYYKYFDSNKAAAINYALKEWIEEEEALIICIDDDIRFPKDFIINYSNAAEKYGVESYFGTSFYVKVPLNFNKTLVPYMSGSTLGKPDKEFEQMENLMFLGFSYAFFKSQWKAVDGLDERFSPGSKYDLAAEESIFQKKLQHAGFSPFLVKDNQVEHRPSPILYTEKRVRLRQEQNGYTHGFQNIIVSTNKFKLDTIKQFLGLLKRTIQLFFSKDRMKFKMKYSYTKGFLKAFILYCRIENRSNYLKR